MVHVVCFIVLLRPSQERLNGKTILGHEHVFPQCGQPPIVAELDPAVVFLGRIGEHLHHQERIRERVVYAVLHDGWAAEDEHIGIGVESRGINLQPLVARNHSAATALEAISEGMSEIVLDQVVPERTAAHRKHLTTEKLVTNVGCDLDRKVFRGGKTTFFGGGHRLHDIQEYRRLSSRANLVLVVLNRTIISGETGPALPGSAATGKNVRTSHFPKQRGLP